MEWQTVGTINTSRDYVLSPIVTGTLFKLKHITENEKKSRLKVTIRQAFEDDGNLALFDYKLINCKNEQDIILFNLPQGLTGRRLAFKRVDNLIDNWTIEIQTLTNNAVIDMPSYPSMPMIDRITTNVNETIIPVNNTVSVVLSAANFQKTGTIITNKSTSKLYVSIGVPAGLDIYDKVLGTNEVFEVPFNWSGEVYGIWDIPDTSESGSYAKVRDFS